MKLILTVLKWLLVVVVLLVLVGAGGGYWFITKSQPPTSGSIRAPGLTAQVEVVRDPMGVPHIYAANADDLFFAQGYVQAEDRLWQMELFRRIGMGRTAEISGPGSINDDKYLRTMGLGRAALADWEAAGPEERRVLTAYSAGVNAFIQSHLENLPLEFTLIGFKPEPWQPVHSIAWAKVMAFDLSGNGDEELLRSRLIEKFGPDKVSQLWPAYPSQGPFIIPPEAKTYAAEIPARAEPAPFLPLGAPAAPRLALLDAIVPRSADIGSNNWVVDGTKTTTGKPLLANDPHLGIQMPSIWYEMGLHCQPVSADCPYNVAGMSFAATPGIVIGHNDRIAWGVTNTGPDVQDYFVEKVNPQNPNQYEYQGKWEDFQVINEIIKVKGAPDEVAEVKVSRHGPIMTPVLDGITQPVALEWTALRERGTILHSVLQIDAAHNWDEFRNALRQWDVPAQNFVYADVDGNIGYQMPGNVPIRAKGDGSTPVPGWTGEYEWKSYIPFDELPFVYNPPTHYIATANHAVVPTTYKYMITQDWTAPFRALRINQMLQGKDKFSPEDIAAIQGDVTSIPLTQLQKYITGFTFPKEKFLPTRAMEYVTKWDGKLTTDSIGAAILEVTYQKLAQNVFGNKMDAALLKDYLSTGGVHRMALLALLDQPNSDWWDDPTTPAKEARDDILMRSYEQAADYLGSQYGDAPVEWKWGRVHTATFAHPVGSVKPLNLLFNAGPLAVPGDGFTIFNTGFRDGVSYDERTVSSMRLIQDPSDWNRTMQIHTTGQSGQPLNKHYSDMAPMWRDVRYAPLYFDRAAVDKVKESAITLTP